MQKCLMLVLDPFGEEFSPILVSSVDISGFDSGSSLVCFGYLVYFSIDLLIYIGRGGLLLYRSGDLFHGLYGDINLNETIKISARNL